MAPTQGLYGELTFFLCNNLGSVSIVTKLGKQSFQPTVIKGGRKSSHHLSSGDQLPDKRSKNLIFSDVISRNMGIRKEDMMGGI